MFDKKHLPNQLTALRIIIIPLMVVALYLPGEGGRYLAAGLFVIAGVSDFFDGYLARHWQVESSLGRFLDPIADKLLIAAIIVALVDIRVIEGIHTLPAIAILCREILVSGLREFLGELQVIVPVTLLAKWKTAAQMLALFLLLLVPLIPVWPGLCLLWISALITLITGYIYWQTGMDHF